MAGSTLLHIIAFLYVVAATTHAHLPVEEEHEDTYLIKEHECWKKSFGDLEIPPAINCSFSASASIEITHMINSIMEAELEKTIPKDIRPDINESHKETILKSLAEAMAAKKSSDLKQFQQGQEDILEMLAAAAAANAGAGGGPQFGKVILPPPLPGHQNCMEKMANLASELKGRIGPPKSCIWSIGKCTGSPDLYKDDHDESVSTLFFDGKSLQPGTKLTLDFASSKNNAPFIDISKIDKSGALSAALLVDYLAISTAAKDAQTDMSIEVDTMNTCEQPAMKGDNKEKTCATSLEAMLNYTMAQVGKDIRPATTWITKEVESAGKTEYTIEKIMTLPSIHSVGCAKLSFPMALYYCQPMPKSVSYSVDLVSSNGVKFKAPAICHEDTSTWNPNSWVFKSVQSKPGGCKLCHFLAADDIVWMPKKEENVAA